MSFFSSLISSGLEKLPDFEPPPEQKKDYEGLLRSANLTDTLFQLLPSDYKAYCLARAILVPMIIIGSAVTLLALNGTLLSFPQNFFNIIQNANWIAAGSCIGTLVVFAIGAAFIIHRVIHKKDPHLGDKTQPGKFWGNNHWVPVVTCTDSVNRNGFADLSTLDADGNGLAYVYMYKTEFDHLAVCFNVLAFEPVHAVGEMAYNAVRLFYLPLFILGSLFVEKMSGMELDPKNRFYNLSDITKQMGLSLKRIVQAPFYMIAMVFSAVYAMVDPLNGRKLGAWIAKDWNDDVTLSEGFWSVRFNQSLFYLEGGFSPDSLGRNGFYVAGCWQPYCAVYFKNFEIDPERNGISLSKLVKSQSGVALRVYTKESFHKLRKEQIDQLNELKG